MLRPALPCAHRLIAGVLACLVLPASAATLAKVERRCGWFENPEPSNATLTDRDGVWEIASQGGYQATGDWPRFKDSQWVRTNGNHGYGCACVTASADPQARTLDNLTKASARPLKACRTDATLHEPARPASGPGQLPQDAPLYQATDFSFRYPRGWTVSKNRNCVVIDHPDRRSNEEYTLNLCVQHGTLEEATESLVFWKENGVWMRGAGMDAPSPVDQIQGPGWKGLLTYQSCGISDSETGFHAAGGSCLMAVVYNAKTQLLLDSVGFYQDYATLHAIVDSIRFTPR